MMPQVEDHMLTFDLIDFAAPHHKGQRCGFAFATLEEARNAQREIGGAVVDSDGTLYGGW